MGSMFSKPKVQGPSQAQLDAQAAAEKRAADAEQKANEQLSSTARAGYGRRTGRRILLAPNRENQLSQQSTLG